MKSTNKELTTERSNCSIQYSNKGNRMYAITVHNNIERFPSPIDYERFLWELEKLPNFKVIGYNYEVGKHDGKNIQSGKLHLHGTLLAPNPLPYMKDVFKLRGYAYKIKPLYQEAGWEDYISKDSEASDVQEYFIRHFWDMDKLEYIFTRSAY